MHTCNTHTNTKYNTGLTEKLKFLYIRFLTICYGLYIQSYSKNLVDIGNIYKVLQG